jgi:hypothetical protein
MNVKELIAVLNKYDPDMPVVISGEELGFGTDYELVQVHCFASGDAVRLKSGEEYEE